MATCANNFKLYVLLYLPLHFFLSSHWISFPPIIQITITLCSARFGLSQVFFFLRNYIKNRGFAFIFAPCGYLLRISQIGLFTCIDFEVEFYLIICCAFLLVWFFPFSFNVMLYLLVLIN